MAKKPSGTRENLLPTFVFVQSSQWLPGSAETLETGTDSVLAEDPSIVAYTEIFSRKRGKQLLENGYEVHHVVGKDSAVAWDVEMWDVLYAETRQVTDLHYWTRTGKATKPMSAAFVVLKHKVSGHVILVVALHAPPHIEGRGGPGDIWRPETIRRWQVLFGALSGIREVRRELRKTYNFDAQVITGDWNLNIMRAPVRAWFKTQFPSMNANFSPNYKGVGTLGRKKGRAVDFSLMRGVSAVGEPTVKRIVSSDHKTARTTMLFNAPAKNVPVVTPELTEHECPSCGNVHTGVVKTTRR